MDLNRKEYQKELLKFEMEPQIQLLKEFSQHRGNTTFQHCENVALFAYDIAQRLHWELDADDIIKAAMLHDYYLYNTSEMEMSDYEHGVTHPKRAIQNAQKHFELNENVRGAISSHMWPLPFSPMPKTKLAIIINLADKYSAFMEMQRGIRNLEKYRAARRQHA